MSTDTGKNALISSINGLQEVLSSGILDETGTAEFTAMKTRNIDNFIKKYHPYMICQRKNGLYQTKLPDERKSSITAKSEEALKQKLFEYYSGAIKKTYSISDIYPLWWQERHDGDGVKKRAIGTLQHNNEEYARFIKGRPIDTKPISEVTGKELFNFFQEIVGDGELRRSTLGNVKTIISGCFDYAVRNDICTLNICRAVNTSDLNCKVTADNDAAYTDEQREKVLVALQGSDNLYDLAICVMFCLCTRIGEVLALKWSDIDLDKKTVCISHSLAKREGKDGRKRLVDLPYPKGKKQSGVRTLPVSPRLAAIISRIPKRGEYLFSSTTGSDGFMQHKYINEHLKAVTTTLGMPYMSSHKIRFWAVTSQFAHHSDLITIQRNAGHADKETTLHYGTGVMVGSVNAIHWNEVFN